MTLVTFPFNGTSGTTATTGNTGAFSFISGTNSTQQLQSGAAYQGTTGLRFVSDGTAASAARFKFSGSATATQAAFSVRIKIPASTPSAAVSLLQVNDTAATRVLQVQYTSTGLVKVNDKSNTTIQVLSAAQATAGSSFRIELVITALSATTGAYTCRAYSSGSTQVGSTATTTTANTGTTNMDGVYIGNVNTIAGTFDIDSLQLNDGSTAEIGEYSPNTTPPTITSISANQTTTPGTSTNLTVSGTAYNGDSVTGYAWTLVSAIDNTGAAITGVSITNASSQNASITPAPGKYGRYIIGCVITDTSGNQSSQSTTRVFVPGTAICPIEVTSNTGWSTVTVGNVNDASDATYAESGATGSGGVLLYRLAPLQAATSGFSMTVHSMVQSTGGSQTVDLMEGATVRKAWGAISPATAFGDVVLTLTSGEMATVTSWNELDIRLTQV